MRRRCGSLLLAWAWTACLLSTESGCALHRCNFERGEALGLRTDCDPHSSHIYRHYYCHAPFRDPRIPGPKIVSTLPAVPEMAATSNFCPLPTYPVFGPRSEEPDGIDMEMQPLRPGDGSIEEESLPEPALPDGEMEDDQVDDVDAEVSEEEGPALELAAPGQSVKQVGWKAARKGPTEEPVSRPCAKCTVTFKRPSALQR